MGLLFRITAVLSLLLLAAEAPPLPTPHPCSTVEALTITPNDDLDPRWSPDGSEVAFVGHHEGNPEIYVVDVATRSLTNISNSPEDDYRPIWSPDGDNIAFFHRQVTNYRIPFQLRIAHLPTGEVISASENYSVTDARIAHWAADGGGFLYVEDRRYLRYDLASGQRRTLLDWNTGPALTILPWSHERLNQPELFYGVFKARSEAYVLDTISGQREFLFSNEIETPRQLLWSPDGTHLAFTVGIFPGTITLYFFDRISKAVHQVSHVKAAAIFPAAWSADNRLVWGTSTPTTSFPVTLFITETRSRVTRQILQLPMDIRVVGWSPVRDHLAFLTYAGAYVIDVPSGIFRDFIQGVGYIQSASWSGDGNYLAARIIDSGTSVVVVSDIRTGENCVYGGSRYGDPQFYVAGTPFWSSTANRLVFSAQRRGDRGNQNVMMISMTD